MIFSSVKDKRVIRRFFYIHVVTIANTIYYAIGFRITDLQITPERILAAIKNKKT